MDGNGRWARQRGLPRLAGHRAGTENIRRVLTSSVEIGIQILTIYAFSTENWKRPEEEVKGLMSIFARVIDRELEELHRQGVQLRHVGRLEGISDALKAKVYRAIDLTKNNDRIVLNVAFNYGGRAEIVDAVRRIIRDGITEKEIDELKTDLESKGIAESEIKKILSQVKDLPREMVQEALRALEHEVIAVPEVKLTEAEIEALRKQLKLVGVPKAEIDKLILLARELPKQEAEELLRLQGPQIYS